MAGKTPVGQILVNRQKLTRADLERTLETQLVYGGRLGTNLVELGFARLDDVGQALAYQHKLPYADAEMFATLPADLLDSIPADDCLRFGVIPLERTATGLQLGMLDPIGPHVKALSMHFGCKIDAFVMPELRYHYLLERYYGIPRAKRFLRIPDGGEHRPGHRQYLGATVRPATGEVAMVMRLPDKAQRDDRATRVVVAPVSRQTAELAMPERMPVPARAVPDPQASQLVEDPAGLIYLDTLPRQLRGRDTDIDLDVGDLEFIETHPVEALIAELDRTDRGGEIARQLVAPLFDNSGLSVLFWVRGQVAVACCAEGTSAPDRQIQQLAVGLDTPSAFQWALQLRGAVRVEGTDDATQYQIASFLTTPLPGQVCVAPVMLGSKVVNLICIHSLPRTRIPTAVVNDLRDLAEAASRAYERLRHSILR